MQKLILAAALVAASPAHAHNRYDMSVAATRALVEQYAAKHGVPTHIAHGVVRVESGGRCHARNRSGASGIMQVMPRTAAGLGVRGPLTDCRVGLDTGMRYLAEAIRKGGAGCAGVSLYNLGTYARPRCTSYGRKVLGGGR